MKITKLALVLVLLFTAIPAFAERAKVTVDGMVCAFCAQGIKKKFTSHESVKKCNVSLEEKFVELEFHEGKSLGDEDIKTMIRDSGYNVRDIVRGKE